MAYTDDAVKAKLSALNESQESIVTVSQWVMFHRRHAEKIAQIWLQRVRDSPPPKRLSLIYLANEVAQQSKVRRRDEFLIAFSPIVAEATAIAYKGASNDIQEKIRRNVEVWRRREVFEIPILDAIESRMKEIDETRSTTKKQTLGGSFFKDSSTGSTPSELQPLVPLQVALTKAAMTSNTSANTATTEYEKMNDPQTEQPLPPVQAARLSHLLKTLASAESSVSEVIKSRRALIDGLEKLLATNRSELTKEESLASQLAERKTQTDTKKREVEDAIMRGFTDDASGAHHQSAENEDSGRPQVEGLTPPPVEAITPVGSPKPEPSQATHGPFADEPEEPLPEGFSLPGISHPDDSSAFPDPSNISPGGGNDFDLGANGSGAKRRKTTHDEEDYSQFAGGDLDDDVAALLASQEK